MNESQWKDSVELRFTKLEQIIKAPLPKSARIHRAWWANERTAGRHVQASAWLLIGWKVLSVDLKTEIVIFFREESYEPKIR